MYALGTSRAARLLALYGLLLLALGGTCAWAQLAPGAAESRRAARQAEAVPLILEMRLDGRVVLDALSAYQSGDRVLLPLGELARQLGLAIQVDPARGQASGYVLREDRTFGLNVDQGVISFEGRQGSFEPRLARVIDDEIYVSEDALSRWLPIDFAVDLPTLQLRVQPREPLPLQSRLERERAAAAFVTPQQPQTQTLPLVREPYRLIAHPFIDQTFGGDARFGKDSRQYNAAYTAYLTADVLGLEGSAYVSATRGDSGPDWRFTLSRHDPEPQLLGPLRARAVQFGDIQLPGTPNLSGGSSGKGWLVTNRPLELPFNFDRQSLRGDLPPGWDVTLYYNDALAGFQQSRPDGRYAFDDLPLAFGPNEFLLVFNGPLGQMRSQRSSFLLDAAASVAPGELLYVGAQQRDSNGGLHHLLSADLGLARGLVLNGAALRVPRSNAAAPALPTITDRSGAASEERSYGQLGLRYYLRSSILRGELNWAENGGKLADLGLKTRLGTSSLDLQHTQAQGDFDSPGLGTGTDRLKRRLRARVVGTVALGPTPKMPYALEAQRLELQSGGVSDVASARLSTLALGTAVTSSISWLRSAGTENVIGSLQLSRRLAGYGLSSQLGYSIAPHVRMDAATVSVDHSLDNGVHMNATLLRVFETKTTVLSGGLNRSFGRFAVGITGSVSGRRELAVGLQLFMGLGRDPRTGRWYADALPLAGSGAVAARAFVDRNLNGRHDPGEEFVSNAGFLLGGGGRHPQRTRDDGTVLITRLAPHRYTDISLDPSTLDDPQWSPRGHGVRVLPRPGRTQLVEFAVASTSDIDGTVFVVDAQGKRPIGNAVVELVKGDGEVMMHTRSSGDGFYLLHQVLPGRYRLRVSSTQAKEFGLVTGPERQIDVQQDSDFISGQDLELRRQPGAAN